jgi:hypothetical protein
MMTNKRADVICPSNSVPWPPLSAKLPGEGQITEDVDQTNRPTYLLVTKAHSIA